MSWHPPNLASKCVPDSNLTACSSLGFAYLSLLVQLYSGRSLQTNRLGDDSSSGAGDDCEFEKDEEYDFIVVGAGSAGCVVANRLTEVSEWKVLLLEAGTEQPDVTIVPGVSGALTGSSLDWGYATQPENGSCLARPGGSCGWPRGKTMGGSSSINSMLYIRGHKLDFDHWAALGNDGWSFDEVLPYFKKSEDNLNIEVLNHQYHSTGGEQSVSFYPHEDGASKLIVDAFTDIGVLKTDFNGPNQMGVAVAQTTSAHGERVSTNNAFIDPIRGKRKNLTIKTESVVNKILFDENKRAYGVTYRRNGVVTTAKAKKEVILSAGAIDSPKLLMLSGIGPRKHLEALNVDVIQGLPVGENLQDHVTFNGICISLTEKTSNMVADEVILQDVRDYKDFNPKRGPLSSDGPVTTMAFVKTEPNLIAPDIQYDTGNLFWREFVNDPVNYDNVKILPTAYYDGLLIRVMPLERGSLGRLVLNASNPEGAPVIFANYFDRDEEIQTILRGIRFLLKIEDTTAFNSSGAQFVKTPLPACKQYDWGTDDYFICLMRSYTGSGYHPVGSCKMGPTTDKTAVVDPKLRVYGTLGLRVVDASIMPDITRGNTNAPSILIGEMGADFVKRDWVHK